MIQVANDRIPTLALHLANFLCCTMMDRAHPGLTIYASLSDLTRLLHLYSSHNYCLCSFHKWSPLRPMVQVQHCTHFAYSVELLFVDSIDVCDCVCAKPNEILLKWHLKMGEMKLEKTEKKKTGKRTNFQLVVGHLNLMNWRLVIGCCYSSRLIHTMHYRRNRVMTLNEAWHSYTVQLH